jgi:hypothetical protein
MDFSRLNPEQLAQLQSLFNQTLQNPPPAVNGNTSMQNSLQSTSLPMAASQPPLNNPPSQVGEGSAQGYPLPVARPTDPISPYQSQRSIPLASQGHPSTAVTTIPAVSGPSMQPFLGLDRLGLSMAGQVNQRRLSSAAATLPCQPQLTRRGRRGPATPAPSLRRSSVPKVEDCISTTPDAQGIFSISIKAKIYPPQVSCSHQHESYEMNR